MYVKSFSPRFKTEQLKPVKLGQILASTSASIQAGKKVYEKLQCGSCHGTDGAGTEAITNDFVDDWGNELGATNLTEPWIFRGGATAEDIYLRFRTGIDGTPMPSFIGSASDQEMWQLANYVVSLARKPTWQMTADEINKFYTDQQKKITADPAARGKYLVNSLGCADCHSPRNEDGTMMEQFRLAGGQRWSCGPYGDYFSRNLTSDKETGLGNWSDEEIKQAMTRGTAKDGRRFLPFTMPWTAYANLNNEDLSAIVSYLRTVPPVYNNIPLPKSLNVFSYLWGKFKMLILREDFPSVIHPGNTGTTKDKPLAAHRTTSTTQEAQ
jgi:mono/diheme cytochrome c family protein